MAIKCTDVKSFTKSNGTFVKGYRRCIDTTTGQEVDPSSVPRNTPTEPENNPQGQNNNKQGENNDPQPKAGEVCIDVVGYFRADGTEVEPHKRCIDPSTLSETNQERLRLFKDQIFPNRDIRYLDSVFNNETGLPRDFLEGKLVSLDNEDSFFPGETEPVGQVSGVFTLRREEANGLVEVRDGDRVALIRNRDEFYGREFNQRAINDTDFSTGQVLAADTYPIFDQDFNRIGDERLRGYTLRQDLGNGLALVVSPDNEFRYIRNSEFFYEIGELPDANWETGIDGLRSYNPTTVGYENFRSIQARLNAIDRGVLPNFDKKRVKEILTEVDRLRSLDNGDEVPITISGNGPRGTVCFQIGSYSKDDGTIVDSHERCIPTALLNDSDFISIEQLQYLVNNDETTTLGDAKYLDQTLDDEYFERRMEEQVRSAAQVGAELAQAKVVSRLQQEQINQSALAEKYGLFDTDEGGYSPKTNYTVNELDLVNEFHIDAMEIRNEAAAELLGVPVDELFEIYDEFDIRETLQDNGQLYFENGRELLDLTGVLTDAAGEIRKLDVSYNGFGNYQVNVRTDVLSMNRGMDSLVVSNEFFKVFPGEREGGIGVQVFANQVNAVNDRGMWGINVSAAGSPSDAFNGYYTWAAFGYEPRDKEFLSEYLQQRGAPYSADTFEELFSQEGGRQWWKENGRSWAGFFNTRQSEHEHDVSSIDRLNEYLIRKKRGLLNG